MTCPHHQHKLRSDLPPLIPRIARLPIDERGFPVPWFVQWIDGKPEFRMMDGDNLVRAVKEKLCWVCGEPLGVFKTFCIGPMCAVNRNTAEPPSHLDCATWSVKGCPFLSRPTMVRREDEFTDAHKDNVAGISIDRNPGVVCLWTVRNYNLRRDPAGSGGVLFTPGEPNEVTWWREGRSATRLEILQSIDSGMPKLVEICADEEERQALQSAYRRMMNYLPA